MSGMCKKSCDTESLMRGELIWKKSLIYQNIILENIFKKYLII